MTVNVYSKGLAYCSVCAPKDMSPDDVAVGTNMENPTGIGSQWKISSEDFNEGGENPHTCEDDTRRHWLLVC